MTLGDLIIKISADDKELQNTLSGIGSKLKSILSFSVAGFSLKKIFDSSVDAASKFEDRMVRLHAILKATGGVSGMTAKSILDTASALKEVTAYSQGTIIEAETMLLSFTKIGKDIFPRAAQATLDLASFMKTDAVSAARTLGLALQEPDQGARALKAANIILEKSEKDLVKSFIETGNHAASQKFILDKLSGSIGGQAAAAADTYSGRTQKLSNEITALSRNLGQAFLPELKNLVSMAASVLRVVNQAMAAGKGPEIEQVSTEKLKEFASSAQKYANENPTLWKLGFGGIDAGKVVEVQKELKKREEEQRNIGKIEQKRASEEWLKQHRTDLDSLYNIAKNYEEKKLSLEGNTLKLSKLQEETALQDLDKLTTLSEDERQKTRTNITRYYAEERKRIEMDNMKEIANISISQMQGVVTQLSAINQQYMTNKTMEIDQQLKSEMDGIQNRYDAEAQAIESSVATRRQKDAKLKALDEKRAREEKKAQEKADKEKRKLEYENAKRQKAINIVNAIMATAVSIIQAWTNGPWVGLIMTPIIAALGAAQVALIASQPLPKLARGGLFRGPAIIGESGREFAFPLEGKEGRAAINEMASALTDAFSRDKDDRATVSVSEKRNAPVILTLDGNVLAKWTSDQIDNGNVIVASRSVM